MASQTLLLKQAVSITTRNWDYCPSDMWQMFMKYKAVRFLLLEGCGPITYYKQIRRINDTRANPSHP